MFACCLRLTQIVTHAISHGHLIPFPRSHEIALTWLCSELAIITGDTMDVTMSVDEVALFVAATCLRILNVQVGETVVRSNLAHIIPHVISPSLMVAWLYMFSDVMKDSIGTVASAHLRRKLAHELFGSDSAVTASDGMDADAILQDPSPAQVTCKSGA